MTTIQLKKKAKQNYRGFIYNRKRCGQNNFWARGIKHYC